MCDEDSCIRHVAYQQQTGSDKLHSRGEKNRGKSMLRVVDVHACSDLRHDGHGLDAERVRVDGGLREAVLVVLEPEEQHALEGEGFQHGGDDGETDEDVAGGALVLFYEKRGQDVHGRLHEDALQETAPSDIMPILLLRRQARKREFLLRFTEIRDSGRFREIRESQLHILVSTTSSHTSPSPQTYKAPDANWNPNQSVFISLARPLLQHHACPTYQ